MINPKFIKKLSDMRACDPAINFLRKPNLTPQEAIGKADPNWLQWALDEGLFSGSTALAEYNRIADPAQAEYSKIVDPALKKMCLDWYIATYGEV